MQELLNFSVYEFEGSLKVDFEYINSATGLVSFSRLNPVTHSLLANINKAYNHYVLTGHLDKIYPIIDFFSMHALQGIHGAIYNTFKQWKAEGKRDALHNPNEEKQVLEVPQTSDIDNLIDAINVIKKTSYNARIDSVEGVNDTITLKRGLPHTSEIYTLQRCAERLEILERYLRKQGVIIKQILPF